MTKKNLIFFNSKSGEGKSAEIADYVVEQLEKNGQQAEKLLTSSKRRSNRKDSYTVSWLSAINLYWRRWNFKCCFNGIVAC